MGYETVNHCNEGFSWILSNVTGIVNSDTHTNTLKPSHIYFHNPFTHTYIQTYLDASANVQTTFTVSK